MQYKIYAALMEDINSGYVWLISPQVDQRPLVWIRNLTTGKKVYCEALRIDQNFQRIYKCGHTMELDLKKNPLVINEWYRKKLGIPQTKEVEELDTIICKDKAYPKLHAVFQHPQLVVRVASVLGVISVMLGIVGVLMGIMSLCNP